jgi:hypothetical protein
LHIGSIKGRQMISQFLLVRILLTAYCRTTNNHSTLQLARISALFLRSRELTLSTLLATTSYQQTMATSISMRFTMGTMILRTMTYPLMKMNSTKREKVMI